MIATVNQLYFVKEIKMADKNYPLSKTQQAVMSALGLTATNWHEAEELFAKYGLAVKAKRQGRQYVPQITNLATVVETGGGWNAGGDGDSYEITREFEPVDLSKIQQWMVQ
jgi:hypothetical protein